MKDERPELNKELNAKDFRNYYYLKEEMVVFCRTNNILCTGSKEDLAKRIEAFLSGDEVIEKEKKRRNEAKTVSEISEDSFIEENFVCSQKHRKFFREKIGKSFSFNVGFQNWLKTNSGKTYKDAIIAYHEILNDRKNSEKKIARQFEYNAYIRDFFKDNKDKSLNEAIICWKYKKNKAGIHKYERSDLVVLNENK